VDHIHRKDSNYMD